MKVFAIVLSLLCAQLVFAADGKLLLTGGVSTIDGPAGGGLSPWAVTGGYATEGQLGGTAYLTGVRTGNYALTGYGAAVSWNERVEASVAHQDFDARDNLAPLGLPGLHLRQDIFGLKLRLLGDAILDSDTLLPQVAVGLLHRRADPGGLGPTLNGPLGARDGGTEFYASATKLLLRQAVLVNLTLRLSDANQGGLLGFGGAQAGSRRLLPEVTLAWLPSRFVAIGAEARIKPDNLNRSVLGAGALKEDDWFDLFVAWTPNKHVSLTLAAVDLGRIAPALQPKRQRGGYLSAQLAY
ncbi:MAG: DUF3034 family protein [Pseudomonadota bacterium]|nr:DUF3034 family protein [Pseudomonadota bacterium]